MPTEGAIRHQFPRNPKAQFKEHRVSFIRKISRMQSMDVLGARDGYISDEEFPPLAELPPLSPTRNDLDLFAENTNNASDNRGDEDKENEGDKQRPHRLVNRKPQPKLDAVRLCSDRGLPMLSKHFEQVKFKGKGHEVGDLNRLMSTMEHWAHRLFPKMPFDEVIDRIEKLGKKRAVQTCIKKIRLDMPLMDEDFVEPEGDAAGTDVANDRVGDEDEMDTFSQFAGQLSQPVGTPTNANVLLSEEQRERMEQNKRRAMERRKSKGQATPASDDLGITTDELQDLERYHANDEDMEKELWNDIAMFEASQRNIWKVLPRKTNGHPQKETDSTQMPARKQMGTGGREDIKGISKDIIVIDDEVSEDEADQMQGVKETRALETTDINEAGGPGDGMMTDSRQNVIDLDADASDKEGRTSAGEKRDEVAETIDGDWEDEGKGSQDEMKDDGEGNRSSDLVLKWDSESADESTTVLEPSDEAGAKVTETTNDTEFGETHVHRAPAEDGQDIAELPSSKGQEAGASRDSPEDKISQDSAGETVSESRSDGEVGKPVGANVVTLENGTDREGEEVGSTEQDTVEDMETE
ncbi:chromosome segregation in meiosis protein 3-like isoform X2 [Acanthaster planci]|uniref:TIMELESS-interacting protein n=1 Tax=Acanthaster planci TaxID=133434 RepID=A0A8B7Z299_ACAPL|nr:chromosome segregation in meiosis protein 3-like isoform X2 [Acanthaster planci]